MPYILGLFLILTLIFSSIGGNNFFGNLLGQAKDKVTATIFPKTEREIIIDNLNSNNQYLDKFFSETAPEILNSKNVSEKDKETIKKALENFNSSKTLISNLSKLENAEKNPLKTVGNLIEKVLDLTNSTNKVSPAPSNLPVSNFIDPTSIPPQCKLICNQ